MAEIIIHGNVLVRVPPELTSYTIPEYIKIIGRDAFKFSNIREIAVPYGVTTLDICAFAYSNIERITLPESVKIIGAHAFSHCEKLQALNIPRYVTRVDDNAFENLPNCVLTIENEHDDEELFNFSPDAFGRREVRIKEICVPNGSVAMRYAMKRGLPVTVFPRGPAKLGNSMKYRYKEGGFCCDGTTLHEYFGCDQVVQIPRGIWSIDDHAFMDTNVKEVYFHKSVKWIGKHSFAYCENLVKVAGEGVRQVGEHAFVGCKNLESVDFPELESCYDISFEDCDRLKRENIRIPETAEVIRVEHVPCGCGHDYRISTPFCTKGE